VIRSSVVLVCAIAPCILQGQDVDRDQMSRVLDRLDALERQNQELLAEIRSLREQLTKGPSAAPTANPAPAGQEATATSGGAAAGAAGQAPLAEQISVSEQQIKDLAQSKVESEHRDPVQLTGMVLFNAFDNGRYAGGDQDPVAAAEAAAQSTDGASLRQTILGLTFQAPEKIAGMDVSGSAYMDFFAGTGTSLDQLMRLRVASVNFGWTDTTFTVAQDKPIIAPREPDSLAQVGFSPLTWSGNLWLWSPQARVEQRFHFGESAGLRAQVGVYQTSERLDVPAEYATVSSGSRPALEGRFVFWKASGSKLPFEIAPGFHVSESHVAGFSVPSRIVTLDWQAPLSSRVTLTGTVFRGENMGVVGGLQQGVNEGPDDLFHAVRGWGGWAQLKFQATKRLTFDLYGGQEDDQIRDLILGQIGKNETYAANAIYRVMSNVLASFEWSYLRTSYVGTGVRFNPHYDLAFAYLF
jgi:hypothetical protein